MGVAPPDSEAVAGDSPAVLCERLCCEVTPWCLTSRPARAFSAPERGATRMKPMPTEQPPATMRPTARYGAARGLQEGKPSLYPRIHSSLLSLHPSPTSLPSLRVCQLFLLFYDSTSPLSYYPLTACCSFIVSPARTTQPDAAAGVVQSPAGPMAARAGSSVPWSAVLALSACSSMPVPTVWAQLCSAAELGDGWAESWLHLCISASLVCLELGEGQGGPGSCDHSMSRAGESGPVWLCRALCGASLGSSCVCR